MRHVKKSRPNTKSSHPTQQRKQSVLESRFVKLWEQKFPQGTLDDPNYFGDPYREFQFHLTRKWRLDFAWPSLKVAVELHGGSFSRGRHNRGVGQFKDLFKINEAQRLGWIVLQFNTLNFQNQTRRVRMIEYVVEVLTERYEQISQAENYVQDVNDLLTFGITTRSTPTVERRTRNSGYVQDHTGSERYRQPLPPDRPKPKAKVPRARS